MKSLISVSVVLACSTVSSAFSPLSSMGSSRTHLGGPKTTFCRSLQVKSSASAREEWEFFDDQPEGSSEGHEERRRRLDDEILSKFVTGDELHLQRQHVLKLRTALRKARRADDARKVLDLERAIIEAQARDAEFAYTVSLDRLQAAERNGHPAEIERIRTEAMEARNSLPQFNLEGLWVGK